MSRLPFELLLALRYLRPKRTFVSIITLISILGVTLGVAVLIIVISVMSGFDHQLREKILGFYAHLRIAQVDDTHATVTLQNYAQITALVKSNQAVVTAAPFAMWRVMLETEPAVGKPLIDGPFLRGVDPATADASFSLIYTNILPGGTNDLGGNGLLVGVKFANAMRLGVGDRVALFTPEMLAAMEKNSTNGHSEITKPVDFEIRGIFDTGFYEYDYNFAVTSLANFQDLYHLDDDVLGILVMLKDPYQAGRVKAQIEKALGPGYEITTWQEEDSAMLAVMVEKNVMLYILFFIVIVAAFGITCTLITFVVLKTRDIGVMKALGASGRQIMWIFLSQSMVVSVLGVGVGLVAGLSAIYFRNPFLGLMRKLTGFELFPAKIYGFSELPALLVPTDIAIICGGSFLICLLAAAFPAWHASRLKPVEALRHE